MTSTRGTSRVLTVALLQRLKMEDLIPAPADCEVQSVIKFLNTQIIAPIEIHRPVGLQSFTADFPLVVARNCHGAPNVQKIVRQWVPKNKAKRSIDNWPIFFYTSRNYYPISISVFRMTERRRFVLNNGSNVRRQTATTQGYKS